MRDPFPAWSRKNSGHSRRILRGEALHRKGEKNSSVVRPFPESPRCLRPFQRNLFSLHCLDFHAEDRLPPQWHLGPPCGKASWKILVGKPRGKATDLMIHAPGTRHCCYRSGESARACPLSRRGLTLLSRLQKYPKIHGSTGEESSGSGPDSTQGLRLQHPRERNPERPATKSRGDWPFLKPPERVPEVPI